MNPYRIQVKIGAHEFQAEGSEDSVRADYRDFLQSIQTKQGEFEASNQTASTGAVAAGAAADLTINELNALFKTEGDMLSLVHIPNTPQRVADGLLLTLLGFEAQMHQREVSAGTLIESARETGLGSMDRIDRVVAPHREYLNVGGSRRGTRYSLNNRGRTYAIGVARGLLQ